VSDNLASAFEFVNQTAGDAVAPDFPPASYDAAALPLMHIDGPQPILDILDAAGFCRRGRRVPARSQRRQRDAVSADRYPTL